MEHVEVLTKGRQSLLPEVAEPYPPMTKQDHATKGLVVLIKQLQVRLTTQLELHGRTALVSHSDRRARIADVSIRGLSFFFLFFCFCFCFAAAFLISIFNGKEWVWISHRGPKTAVGVSLKRNRKRKGKWCFSKNSFCFFAFFF